MTAFTSGNSLATTRDALRLEVRKLQSLIGTASAWVEALERDRVPLSSGADAAYDAARLALAQSFLVQLQAETSSAVSTSLQVRVKNTLGFV